MQGRFRLLTLLPAAVICISTLVAASAHADDERYRKMNWEDSLRLSDQQQKDIRRIEDAFRQQIQAMDRANVKERKNEFDRMREEIRSVLTEEQREMARAQMEKQQRKLQLRNLGLLARALDLEPEQKKALKETILAQRASWPMDKEQWDDFREAYDQRLHEVLTAEQMQQLEAMRERQRAKWQHHTMDQLQDGEAPQTIQTASSSEQRPLPAMPTEKDHGHLPPPPQDLEDGLPPELMSPGDPAPGDAPPPAPPAESKTVVPVGNE